MTCKCRASSSGRNKNQCCVVDRRIYIGKTSDSDGCLYVAKTTLDRLDEWKRIFEKRAGFCVRAWRRFGIVNTRIYIYIYTWPHVNDPADDQRHPWPDRNRMLPVSLSFLLFLFIAFYCSWLCVVYNGGHSVWCILIVWWATWETDGLHRFSVASIGRKPPPPPSLRRRLLF